MLTRHIPESLQVTPGPFPDFWVGPGDEASQVLGESLISCHQLIMTSSLTTPTPILSVKRENAIRKIAKPGGVLPTVKSNNSSNYI